MDKRGQAFRKVMTWALILFVFLAAAIIFGFGYSELKAGVKEPVKGVTSSLKDINWGDLTPAQKETLEHTEPELSMEKLYDKSEAESSWNEKVRYWEQITELAEKPENEDKKLTLKDEYFAASLNLAVHHWNKYISSNFKDNEELKQTLHYYNIASGSSKPNHIEIYDRSLRNIVSMFETKDKLEEFQVLLNKGIVGNPLRLRLTTDVKKLIDQKLELEAVKKAISGLSEIYDGLKFWEKDLVSADSEYDKKTYGVANELYDNLLYSLDEGWDLEGRYGLKSALDIVDDAILSNQKYLKILWSLRERLSYIYYHSSARTLLISYLIDTDENKPGCFDFIEFLDLKEVRDHYKKYLLYEKQDVVDLYTYAIKSCGKIEEIDFPQTPLGDKKTVIEKLNNDAKNYDKNWKTISGSEEEPSVPYTSTGGIA